MIITGTPIVFLPDQLTWSLLLGVLASRPFSLSSRLGHQAEWPVLGPLGSIDSDILFRRVDLDSNKYLRVQWFQFSYT